MRTIKKGPEPAALRAYRAVPGATWDAADFTPVKDEIRDRVLADQEFLCCYCMRRVSADRRPHPTDPVAPPDVLTKIDHWRSRARHPELQLTWSNMLGACLGGEGVRRADQTCDTHKGDDAIALDPQDPSHMATLRCRSSGRLESTNPQFQADIDERLNLNHRILVEARKSSLKRDLERLKLRFPKERVPPSAVRRAIADLEALTDGRARELCGVLRLWANRRFAGERS